MKSISLFLLLLIGLSFSGVSQEREITQMVDCGKDQVVLLPALDLKRGNYAIGWTIRPIAKDAKPVDWKGWMKRKGDIFALMADYDTDSESRPAPYQLIDCVVDLKTKKVLDLPSDWPYHPHKNRGYLAAQWSPAAAKTSFVLIENDARFYTHNLWLVDLAEGKMQQIDLVPRLEKPVRKALQQKKSSTYKEYGLYYPVNHENLDPVENDVVFRESFVSIPVFAAIPKTGDGLVHGTAIVHLPGGRVGDISLHASKSVDIKNQE